MNQLLGQDARNTTSPVSRALKSGHYGPKTNDEAIRCGSLSRGRLILEVVLVCRSITSSGSDGRIVLSACLPGSIPHLLGHCFGASATPGGTASFCFPDSSPRTGLGPSPECTTWHLGVAPTRMASPRCDPSRSGIQNRRHDHVSEQSDSYGLPRQRC
jgi:hypothetical protein